jgi:hypothetical protein
MARVKTRTPQQRDARELALTRPADPYRGALTDPYPAPALIAEPAAQPVATAGQRQPAQLGEEPAAAPAGVAAPAVQRQPGTPGAATWAGILAIVLGLTMGLFGLLLLTIVSLQNDYSSADRSFYRGTDSGYVVLGLLDFGLAACCGIGGIVLLTGRITGRIAVTVGGWAILILAAFWYVGADIRPIVPIIVAVVAAVMLLLSYTPSVTRWLGVLPPPQPS